MWGALDDREARVDPQVIEALAKKIGARAGVILLALDDPARRICLVEVD